MHRREEDKVYMYEVQYRRSFQIYRRCWLVENFPVVGLHILIAQISVEIMIRDAKIIIEYLS